MPVAAPELARRLGPDPDPEAILALPLLHDSDATKWRAWCEAAARRPFRPAARDRRFENYPLTLAAARAGLGVALGQLPIAEGRITALGLVPLSPIAAEGPLAYYSIVGGGAPRAGVERLLARLRAAVA